MTLSPPNSTPPPEHGDDVIPDMLIREVSAWWSDKVESVNVDPEKPCKLHGITLTRRTGEEV